ASAVIGAFLQNRLAISLHDQAVSASGRLPSQYRAPFVSGFTNAAHNGFEVGAGQSGANLGLPEQVQAIAHDVFTNAFVDAMHPTLLLPIVVLVVAAISAAFVRAPKTAQEAVHEQEAAVA
ncbi:MAG TPA: MFS transporter, partial [Candidatus Dormibacteraeota bacterium]|nr:MFS transporter [Candidatus Dormibacteraeota bacterium]